MEKSEKINMDNLAAVLASKWDITKKEAQQFLTDFVETAKEGVNADGQLKIKGLGTFKVIGVDARESVNVNTGERVLIESHQKLTFTPDALMKELVNKPFSHFETVVLNDGVDFPNEPEDTEDTEGTDETENTEKPQTPIVEEAPVEPQEEVVAEPEKPQEVVAEPQEEVVAEPEEPQEVVVEEPEEPQEEVVEEPEEPQEEVVAEPEEPQEEVVTEPEEPQEEVVEEPEKPQEVPAEPKDEEKVMPEKVQPVAPKVSEPVEEQEKSSQWMLWLLLALLACGLSFGAGYWLGGQNKAEATVAEETTVTDEPVVTDEPAVEEATVTDTISQEAPVAAEETPVQPEAAKPEEPKATTGEQVWQKYDAMDQRIRLGYYAIIGLDREVEAKEGETLSRLSRRILGPDMVCYVEAFNGMKASDVLTAGQTIKIPKLISKKKLKEMNKGNE